MCDKKGAPFLIWVVFTSSMMMVALGEEVSDCPTLAPTVQIVQAIPPLNDSSSSLFSLLVINCTADVPTHWTFLRHPGGSSGVAWNVSYTRVKADVLDESGGEMFLSVLTWMNVSRDDLRGVWRPECSLVGGNCGGVGLPEELVGSSGGSGKNTNSVAVGLKQPKNCSVDLWFDEGSGHFVCKSSSDSSLPEMSVRYCANPTECGVPSEYDDPCWEHPGHSTGPSPPTHNAKSCRSNNGTATCASLGVGSEFAVPKVISCSPRGGKGGVKLLGYFHSLKQINGKPASSYVSWDEADPSDLVSITPSKNQVLGNESIQVECSASSYYFAAGLHLTLKGLSGTPSYSEMEVKFTTESVELWRGTQLPVRRTLLANNIVLPPGEYELTCYAPVWNSTYWTEKSVLVSVSDMINPTFVAGNGTTSMEFAPRRNLTCLAKGVPPPRISWIYRDDKFQVIEDRGESKQMSWSHITLPEAMDPSNPEHTLEFKCRAENAAGYSEKVFIITRNDESFLVSTKIAGFVVLLGFVANLIVFFICWKKLFHESEEEDDEERKELAGIKFLRSVWNGEVRCFKWLHNNPSSREDCPHPKCRQKHTQTV